MPSARRAGWEEGWSGFGPVGHGMSRGCPGKDNRDEPCGHTGAGRRGWLQQRLRPGRTGLSAGGEHRLASLRAKAAIQHSRPPGLLAVAAV